MAVEDPQRCVDVLEERIAAEVLVEAEPPDHLGAERHPEPGHVPDQRGLLRGEPARRPQPRVLTVGELGEGIGDQARLELPAATEREPGRAGPGFAGVARFGGTGDVLRRPGDLGAADAADKALTVALVDLHDPLHGVGEEQRVVVGEQRDLALHPPQADVALHRHARGAVDVFERDRRRPCHFVDDGPDRRGVIGRVDDDDLERRPRLPDEERKAQLQGIPPVPGHDDDRILHSRFLLHACPSNRCGPGYRPNAVACARPLTGGDLAQSLRD